jgi:hypothetical protein
VLDHAFRTDGDIVRVLTGVATGAPPAQQIPALVQLHLDLAQPVPVLIVERLSV